VSADPDRKPDKAIAAHDWDSPALADVDAIVVFYDIMPDQTAESYSDYLRPGFTPVLGATVTTVDEEGNRVTGTITSIRPRGPGSYEIETRLDLDTFTSAHAAPADPRPTA